MRSRLLQALAKQHIRACGDTHDSLTLIFLASLYIHDNPFSRHREHDGLSLEQYDLRWRHFKQLEWRECLKYTMAFLMHRTYAVLLDVRSSTRDGVDDVEDMIYRRCGKFHGWRSLLVTIIIILKIIIE